MSKTSDRRLIACLFCQMDKIFAFGEDSLARLLTSELVDLRAVNANLRCFATKSKEVTSTNRKRRRLPPFSIGRGDKIRTCGLYVPNVALYQTEPHLVIKWDRPCKSWGASGKIPLPSFPKAPQDYITKSFACQYLCTNFSLPRWGKGLLYFQVENVLLVSSLISLRIRISMQRLRVVRAEMAKSEIDHTLPGAMTAPMTVQIANAKR